MSLVALTKKWGTCKICSSFDEDTLNEITLDIVLQRRTYKEIGEYYTPKLPAGVPAINDMNIKGHKNHCDPRLIAKEVLEKEGNPTSDSDIASRLYAEIFNEEIDKNKLLNELYRERLINLQTLQTMLDDKRDYSVQVQENLTNAQLIYDGSKVEENRINLVYYANLLKDVQNEIRSVIKQIDTTQRDLQDIIIKEKVSEKGFGDSTIYITQNYVNILQVHMRTFLDELIPVMLREFKEDPARGKRIISMVTGAMDRHIGIALDETKLISQVSSKKQSLSIN